MRFQTARAFAAMSCIALAACAPRESAAREDTAMTAAAQPVTAAAADPVIAVAVAEQHACALTATGDAFCWGNDEGPQLGADLPANVSLKSMMPVPVAGGHHFTAIAAAVAATCALDTEGKAWCWGWGDDGRLGTGKMEDTAEAPKPVVGSMKFAAIAVGDRHACALDGAGSAWCWGGNKYGMLGDSARPRGSSRPVRVVGGHRFRSISAAGLTTCAVDTDAAAWCWGSNSSGELGDSVARDNSDVPVRVHLDHVAEIHPATRSTCARDESNAIWCWGVASAQLFDPTGEGIVRYPQRVKSAPGSVASLFVGQSQACTLSTAGDTYCWGSSSSPVQGLRFKSLSLSGLVCGVATDGHAYCWGHDLVDESPIPTPVRVAFPP